MLAEELLAALKARAADPDRRTNGSGLSADTMDLGILLEQLGPAGETFRSVQSQMGGLMGQFSGIMRGFGVENPLPKVQAVQNAPAPAPATEYQLSDAERQIGFQLPVELRQLYLQVADGGFGPGDGLYPLDQLTGQYRDFTDEPFGPQGQPWPTNLLPICHDEPGEICLDRETGRVIFWDPEELGEGPGNKHWLRSFKDEADSLAALLEKWVDAPTATERMQAQREDILANPMQTHIDNMIDCCSRMTPEERAAMGFDGDNWQDKIRQRYSAD